MNLPVQEEDPHIGMMVADRYRIDSLLGEGGMGSVYRATHLALGEEVAVKFLRASFATSIELRERFRREAIALARVRHPSIVSVLDFGQHQGEMFMVMELVNGDSLSGSIHQLSLLQIATIFDQILSVLDVSHQNGVIHRDMKPDNVMLLANSDHIKVLDFGIAQLSARDGESGPAKLTEVGALNGTPWYMAPEQCRGVTVSPKADVYAVGIMLYEACTGTLPFDGADMFAVITHQMYTEPPPFGPAAAARGVSRAIESVVMGALSKREDERPTARAMRDNLAAAIAGTDAVSLMEHAADARVRAAAETRSDRAITQVRPRERTTWPAPASARTLVWVRNQALADSIAAALAVNGLGSTVVGRQHASELPPQDPSEPTTVVVMDHDADVTLRVQGLADTAYAGVPILVVGFPGRMSFTPLVTLGVADVAVDSASEAEIFRKVLRLVRRRKT